MDEHFLKEKFFSLWDFPILEEIDQDTGLKEAEKAVIHGVHQVITGEEGRLLEDPEEICLQAPLHALKACKNEKNPEDVMKENLLTAEQDGFLEKLHYLNAQAIKIQKILDEFDATILQKLVAIMQKMVKKIILKELEADPIVLQKMIEDSLHEMNTAKTSVLVYVSSDNYALFVENAIALTAIDIKIDPLLNTGDFIIKTPLTDIECILEQRLQTLLGV